MKAVIYLTKRTMFMWPQIYVEDLVKKLEVRDFDVSIISDDTPDEIAKREIKSSRYLIGVPNRFERYAEDTEVIRLLGATKEGKGVVSTVQCAGCLENVQDSMDCLWEDTLCMWEITPNDILEAACL
jgi:hypothetical protein